jgi:cell shape-determining protein MreD
MDFLMRGLFLAAVLTISLEVTVSWLNVVAGQRDRDWSFGQVVALASVLLAVAF